VSTKWIASTRNNDADRSICIRNPPTIGVVLNSAKHMPCILYFPVPSGINRVAMGRVACRWGLWCSLDGIWPGNNYKAL